MAYGGSWFDLAEKQKLLRPVQELWFCTGASNNSEIFTPDCYTNFPGFPNFSEFLELQKYSQWTDSYRLF